MFGYLLTLWLWIWVLSTFLVQGMNRLLSNEFLLCTDCDKGLCFGRLLGWNSEIFAELRNIFRFVLTKITAIFVRHTFVQTKFIFVWLTSFVKLCPIHSWPIVSSIYKGVFLRYFFIKRKILSFSSKTLKHKLFSFLSL